MSNRAVFFDRDGTLIEHYDYLTDPDQVKLLPTAARALQLLKDRNFYLVVVSNQSAIARGMLTEKKLLEIHDRLKYLLSEEGAYLDQIYFCPYHPEGVVDKYRRDSDMRKPAPGMLFLAAKELELDLTQSWVVGDDDRDIQAGRSAKCRTILLKAQHSPLVKRGASSPDYQAVNLQEAANIIIRHAEESALPEQLEAEIKEQDAKAEAPATEDTKVDQANPTQTKNPTKPEKSKSSSGSTVKKNEVKSTPTKQAAPSSSEPGEKSTFLRPDVIATARRKKPKKETEKKPQPIEPETPNPGPEITLPKQPIKKERDHEVARRKVSQQRKLAVSTSSMEESGQTTELLTQILRELKAQNRQEKFTDFSVSKLIAGLIQMLVFLCLITAIWFISAREPDPEKAQMVLLMGVVFQTMTLTLLMMRK